MDYSLYLTVENRQKHSKEFGSEIKKSRNIYYSEVDREIYHIGIIDYL